MRKKMKKQIIAMGMTLAMLMNLFLYPESSLFAKAEETTLKSMELNTEKLAPGDGTWDASNDYTVFFGQYENEPTAFRILQAENNTMLLDSDIILTSRPFDGDGIINDNQISGHINEWNGSDIESWLNGSEYYENPAVFTDNERAIIKKTTLEAKTKYQVGYIPFVDYDATDYVFLLSAHEMSSLYAYTEGAGKKLDKTNSASAWRLRSANANFTDNNGVVTASTGKCEDYTISVDISHGIAPAFNVDTSYILFVSAAEDEKASGTVGIINAINDYSGGEWKLTLLDSSRSFSADVGGQNNVSVEPSGDLQISYSGAQTGDNEYVSVLLCDNNDNILYYGNIAQNSASGTATLDIPSGLAVGNYTLKVFSEQCNGDYKTDYASAFQDIDLKVTLPQETTPDASFEATGDSRGTLSDVDTSMKYSVDGGNTWNDITDTTMEITGVTAVKDVKVYKPGNGTTTSDSEVQTIDVTQASQPAELVATGCTSSAQNDGQITGVDTTMEYRKSGDSDWTAVTGGSITGLVNGTYEVRVKANETALASPAAEVTVDAYVPQENNDPAGQTGSGTTGGSTGTDTGIISDSQKQQNSIWLNRKTSVKTTNKAMKVTWGKVSGADGYDIYVAVAGKKFGGITKSAGSNKKAVTIKKIDGKKLKAKKNYQVKVRAYRMINGQKEYIADGTTLYTVLNSNPKYTNAKKVRVDKKKYTLKKGKKVKIQASVVKQKGSKKLLPAKYGPQFSYMSSDSTVATVSKKGRITAKKKGKCTIYVRALNGTCKKVKVTVK